MRVANSGFPESDDTFFRGPHLNVLKITGRQADVDASILDRGGSRGRLQPRQFGLRLRCGQLARL